MSAELAFANHENGHRSEPSPLLSASLGMGFERNSMTQSSLRSGKLSPSTYQPIQKRSIGIRPSKPPEKPLLPAGINTAASRRKPLLPAGTNTATSLSVGPAETAFGSDRTSMQRTGTSVRSPVIPPLKILPPQRWRPGISRSSRTN